MRHMEWVGERGICMDGSTDWLLKENAVVVGILEYERKMMRHHTTSLAHGAVRQGPGLCVAIPFKGDRAVFVGDSDRSLRLATKPTPSTCPRLPLKWPALADDAVHVTGPANLSLARYAVGHIQSAHNVLVTTVRLRSVCPLASALFCQFHYNRPSVIQGCTTLFSKDQR